MRERRRRRRRGRIGPAALSSCYEGCRRTRSRSACTVVAEQVADSIDDGIDLAVAASGRLNREDDQQAQEVGVVLEPLDGSQYDGSQVLDRAPQPSIGVGHVGEEALCTALHDREQDSVFGAVVVVDGAERDARFLDHASERRGLEAVLRHDPLCGVEDEFAGPHTPAVWSHISTYRHAFQHTHKIGVDTSKHVLYSTLQYCSSQQQGERRTWDSQRLPTRRFRF